MRLSVEHLTQYRFTEPQDRIVQLLRLFPSDTTHQTVVSWRIDVDCDARLRESVDGYGNAIRMLYAEGPLEEVGITVSGEVLLTDAEGSVGSGNESFPPALFTRDTSLTHPDAAIREFAEGITGRGMERLRNLNMAIHNRFTIDRARPGEIRSATEAFAQQHLLPRDVAQVLVSAARAIGFPARYVSGYSLSGSAERDSAAPHGWAEAYVDDHGWIALDPTTGGVPGLDHVRVAVGLDAAAAAPIAGTRIGHGDEALKVAVHVAEADPA